MNTISSIHNWFKVAKPNPTKQNVLQQLNVHIEEIQEMFTAMDYSPCNELTEFQNYIGYISDYDEHTAKECESYDRLALLDSLCDQIVTAIGVAYMLGFDIENAIKEVDKSNWSKFENNKPVINENGKIIKGKNYQKPNLKEFI